jgi:hypothetical protein
MASATRKHRQYCHKLYLSVTLIQAVSRESPFVATAAAKFPTAAATDAELALYGFPPRPGGAARSPRGRRWIETFGRDVSFWVAEFTRAQRSASRPRQPSTINSENSDNWSGIVVDLLPGDPVNLGVAAIWNIPSITSVGSGTALEDQIIGIWTGIDGRSPGTLGLLQAGVSGSFDSSGRPSFDAFTEWLSRANPVQPARPISNFPVEVGDVVEVEI